MHFRDVLWWGVAASLLVGCSRWLFSSNYSNSTAWKPLRIMTKEEQNHLKNEAESLLKEWKGILAADESTGTIGKRFVQINLDNTETNRQRYRELLFTTVDLEKYISGVIMFEETFYQKTNSKVRFVDILKDKGIKVGIKLDRGLTAFGTLNEQISQGLEDLDTRIAEFRKGGCTFAKWRSVFHISPGTPSESAIRKNAEILATYARKCQEHGLVPIVESEVLAIGSHDIAQTQLITEKVLAYVFKALNEKEVYLEGTILKPNMVVPGLSSPTVANSSEVAYATVTALRRTVPPAIPGIAFLSGGQTEDEATTNLKAIVNVNLTKPWKITFSFGRALQTTTLKRWHGAEIAAAQEALIERAKANCNALKSQ
ncbi:unnamed protein product [Enterobius vermicularis]|uniref:Fructose-bisphosphate aldolase n=1 Tax=Enterobius vermicularis TaxID=51028 RepID=A0A0N4V6L5_ENTVE|nr:unnamed protein product [Enterobius vermicularis]